MNSVRRLIVKRHEAVCDFESHPINKSTVATMDSSESSESIESEKCIELDESLTQDVLASVNLVLVSVEGVLLWNEDILPGAVEFMRKLKALKKETWIFSNKGSLSRKMIVKKMHSCGIKSISEARVLCSAFATGYSLKKFMNFYGKVLCCGSEGLKYELEQNGLECITIPSKHESLDELVNYKIDPMVNCVVVGMDEEFTYSKAAKCCRYLAKPFMPLLLTDNVIIPQNKHMAKAIDTNGIYKMLLEVSKKAPDYVIGIPERFMLKVLSSFTNVESQKVLLITDRIMPDILFANRCGFRSILVLTGVSEKRDMERFRDSGLPLDAYLRTEFYSNSIEEVKDFIDVELNSDSDDEEDEDVDEQEIEECDYDDENYEKVSDIRSEEEDGEDCKQKLFWRNFFLGHPHFKLSTDEQSSSPTF